MYIIITLALFIKYKVCNSNLQRWAANEINVNK